MRIVWKNFNLIVILNEKKRNTNMYYFIPFNSFHMSSFDKTTQIKSFSFNQIYEKYTILCNKKIDVKKLHNIGKPNIHIIAQRS